MDCRLKIRLFVLCVVMRGKAVKFFEFVSAMNKELDFVNMEVRGSANQYDGTVFYGLVNKLASEESKLGTVFTHAQLAFFKAVVSSL